MPCMVAHLNNQKFYASIEITKVSVVNFQKIMMKNERRVNRCGRNEREEMDECGGYEGGVDVVDMRDWMW